MYIYTYTHSCTTTSCPKTHWHVYTYTGTKELEMCIQICLCGISLHVPNAQEALTLWWRPSAKCVVFWLQLAGCIQPVRACLHQLRSSIHSSYFGKMCRCPSLSLTRQPSCTRLGKASTEKFWGVELTSGLHYCRPGPWHTAASGAMRRQDRVCSSRLRGLAVPGSVADISSACVPCDVVSCCEASSRWWSASGSLSK